MTLARGDGSRAMAVTGESVLVGVSVTNNDQWRERQRLPHRLHVLDMADGKLRQELPLPAPAILGGSAPPVAGFMSQPRTGPSHALERRGHQEPARFRPVEQSYDHARAA